MYSRLPRFFMAVLFLLAALTIFAAPTFAQTSDTPPDAAPVETTDDAEKDDAEKADKDDDAVPLREQTIYIPYEKLEGVFEKHGRGVFIPYEKFQELWKAARDKNVKPVEPKPPVGAVIGEIENEATVADDVVKVKALLKIEILTEGWNEVPLRLGDSAITSATIDGKPARIIGQAGMGYKLLVENKGKQPKQIELKLEYSKAITRTPGQNKVAFQAPQAPVSRWRVSVDQPGVKVNIHPMIAATEVPETDEPAAETEAEPKGTVILAFVGAAPLVTIDWTPKSEGAAGMEALASVHAEQQVRIDEGVIRTRVLLRYTISRAELDKLVIDVPADHKVVNVFDANVRRWPVEKTEGGQRITAELFEPAKGNQQVMVELEKFAGDQPQDQVGVPVVKAVGVERQQGEVVVKVASGLRAEAVEITGLLQVGAAELPPTLARTKWDFSYRYATVPFQLAFDIEKVQPRILADSLVEAYLEPNKLSLDMTTIYTIQKAGIFRLEIDVPEGYELRQVSGRQIGDARPVRVLTRHLEGEKKTRLVVNLAEKALGKVALVVQLEKQLDQPDLLTPTGKTVDIPLGIPTVVAETVERAAGRLLVYSPESLQVNPGELEGLRAVSFQAAVETVPVNRGRKPAGVRPVLAFAYTQEPTKLALATERRKPRVNVRQLLTARIEDGVVKYNAKLFYNVLYSGIESLRVDVPQQVADLIQNETPAIRKKVITPAPEDLAEGCVAWSFAGESELLGSGTIVLSWEDDKELKELEVGKSVTLEIPRLSPRGIDRAWGQIVLAKVETVDVQPEGEPTALRQIDPKVDLMPGATVPDAARAFEFHDDWKLAVTATRYKLEDVKRTSIERALVRMVVTRSEQVAVQALYRMRSARQRIEVKLPDGVEFDTKPAMINGSVVSLQTEGTKYFVPLVDMQADKPFLLELRYTFPGDAVSLPLPQFPMEPAVQKVYQCVYLPNELALMGKSGNWTDECRWFLDPMLNWRPVPRNGSNKEEAARNLINWVTEGVSASGDPMDSFQTDGRLYVFSTRSPAPPPEGTLCLKTANETWLHGAVFALVLIGGLLLLPVRLGGRALAVGSAIVAVVLIGVFCPLFAMQVLNGTLALAIFVVAVVWGVVFLMRLSSAMAGSKLGLSTLLEKVKAQSDSGTEESAEAELVPSEEKPADKDSAGKKSDEEGGETNA